MEARRGQQKLAAKAGSGPVARSCVHRREDLTQRSRAGLWSSTGRSAETKEATARLL